VQQQTLSGMEIRTLAERIVAANQDSDVDLRSVIEAILRDYILIPKHNLDDQAGSPRD
jgi:hypothetical protein